MPNIFSKYLSKGWELQVIWSSLQKGELYRKYLCADQELILENSLGLINACLRWGNQEDSRQYYELVWILENLGICRYVSVCPSYVSIIVSLLIPHSIQNRN